LSICFFQEEIKMRGKLITLLLVVIVLFGMTLGTTAQDEEPIRVGLLQDLSGWLTLYGVESVNGFQLGLLYAAGLDPLDYDSLEDALADVEVGGRSIELIIRDYGSEDNTADADNAANAARELIESDLVDIIFGTPNSGAAVQVQEQIKPEEYDILFFAGPAASPSIRFKLQRQHLPCLP
jgi:branched-chain amino acid transport system substrate-binding protein